MGNTASIRKVGFEDIQYIQKQCSVMTTNMGDSYLLINTLPLNMQHCLIKKTVSAEEEEIKMNSYIKTGKKGIYVILYGKHACDDSVYKKYMQLTSLGFYEVHVYLGGMFEWLMLQDIYGADEFPTTSIELDLLKYKPPRTYGIPRITDG